MSKSTHPSKTLRCMRISDPSQKAYANVWKQKLLKDRTDNDGLKGMSYHILQQRLFEVSYTGGEWWWTIDASTFAISVPHCRSKTSHQTAWQTRHWAFGFFLKNENDIIWRLQETYWACYEGNQALKRERSTLRDPTCLKELSTLERLAPRICLPQSQPVCQNMSPWSTPSGQVSAWTSAFADSQRQNADAFI